METLKKWLPKKNSKMPEKKNKDQVLIFENSNVCLLYICIYKNTNFFVFFVFKNMY